MNETKQLRQTSLVLVDDHPAFLSALRELVSRLDSVTVVGEACDGVHAVEAIVKTRPDVALIDFSMPRLDGLATIGQLREMDLSTAYVLMTYYAQVDLVRRANELGVAGVLFKDDLVEELGRCVQEVKDGRRFLCRQARGLLESSPSPDDFGGEKR